MYIPGYSCTIYRNALSAAVLLMAIFSVFADNN